MTRNYINFNCQHCRGKIRVPKIHAGKRGKCPRCGRIITIPYESAAIELQCGNCGLKISVPKMYAGKEGFCPKCKCPIPIPREQTGTDENQSDTQEPNTRLVGSAGNLTLLDVPEEYKLQEPQTEQPAEMKISTEQELETEDEFIPTTEPPGHRKLPWPIDIFLYPMCFTGLLHLGIFVGIPFLTVIVRMSLGIYGIAIYRLGFLLSFAFVIYMYWYFSECVRDSAKGGTRAPDAFAIGDFYEMPLQMLYIIACCLIFFAPAGVYYLIVKDKDAIFWLLLAYGIFFFPMGLLATIMFDSFSGLNPVLLIGSVFGSLFQYCGIVLFFVMILVVPFIIVSLPPENEHFSRYTIVIIIGVFYFIMIYISLVSAHLLGRFYWRNQEKLNWEV